MRRVLGWAIRAPGVFEEIHYATPGPFNWSTSRHLWPTKRAAKQECDLRGLDNAKIVRVVRRVRPAFFIIRAKHPRVFTSKQEALNAITWSGEWEVVRARGDARLFDFDPTHARLVRP